MDERTANAYELMMRFEERARRAYLWTDAFAVCNLLALSRPDLALRRVDRVHGELARHRSDDRRSGWLSGLPDAEAREHPTRGGLRIGKALNERGPEDPFDLELEWDRDGQYFHYLTKWMHALDQVARHTGHSEHRFWARELATVAHRAFTYGPPGSRRMVWKLSIDLSRALVPSMGQHDPLDGFVICTQLDLPEQAEDFRSMIDQKRLTTTDPLGIGSLLIDACRLAQIDRDHELLPWLVDAAVKGLERYLDQGDLRMPAHLRLGFRELGLAIGLGASPLLGAPEIAPYLPLRAEIEAFWREPRHRRTAPWLDHLDINEVMLATSLDPFGLLALRPRAAHEEAHPTPM